ncbi:hypothetical protein QP938_08425 [Porticoccaceae bacterium LTM1]|nr:hypothetical protein QP938_08425 [Porticoccaceae bacterium LTM1]
MSSVDQGQESVVYGCIKDIAAGDASLRRRINREAILALPDQEGWPILSREMFAVPALEVGAGGQQTQVMHFGASYLGIEYEWTHWMQQFEELLRKMYWVSATVHLETELSGTHSFIWEASGDYHSPNSDDIQIRCEWTHEGWLSAG